MGGRGTDVAREAAALVLLDDRFTSLVDAVGAGRRIFGNLQKAIGYLFAVHVPIVGLSLLPLFGGPVLLLPLHVVLFELIIDPACSLVFEAEPAPRRSMQVPPRAASAALVTWPLVVRALAIGGLALVFAAVVQWAAQRAGASDMQLRLAGVVSVVVGNLAMLQWFRSGGGVSHAGNRVFQWLVLGVCVLGGVIGLVPAASEAFGLPALPAVPVLLALGAPAGLAGWRLLAGRAAASTSRTAS